MGDENEEVVASDERRKSIFWLVAALGLVIALKGVVLFLGLTGALK